MEVEPDDPEVLVVVGVVAVDALDGSAAPSCAPSKAATTSKVEMKLREEQPELPEPEVDAVAAPLEGSGLSEESTETRVTPSTSWSAAMKLATASWLTAQPLISSDGPATFDVSADAPLELLELVEVELGALASAEAFALRSVSQTSEGITIATSRSTRCQSKRLSARLVTVTSRAC